MVTPNPPQTAEDTRVAIRGMRPDDLDAVVQLDAYVSGDPRSTYFERRLASLSAGIPDTHTIGLVAETDGIIVGFVMGALTNGEFGFSDVTALVDSIAVHPDQRRRGIGQQLARAFVAEAVALGAREVYTLVNWNAWEMLKFFDSIGFSLAQTVPLRMRIGEDQGKAHEPG